MKSCVDAETKGDETALYYSPCSTCGRRWFEVRSAVGGTEDGKSLGAIYILGIGGAGSCWEELGGGS